MRYRYLVHAEDNPGNPWGPFATLAEAAALRNALRAQLKGIFWITRRKYLP